MKINEILHESRRNPSLNPKIKGFERVRARYENNPDTYVNMIGVDKLGMNPMPNYNTPIGIYSYPAEYVLSVGSFEDLPYAGKKPYANIFNAKGNILDISNMDGTEFISLVKKLKIIFSSLLQKKGVELDIEQIIMDAEDEARSQTHGGKFWNIIRNIAVYAVEYKLLNTSRAYVAWTVLFRSIGVDGCVDWGLGIIHPSEGTQAVFFGLDSIINIERVYTNTFNWKLSGIRAQIEYVKQDMDNIMHLYHMGVRPGTRVQLAAVAQDGLAIGHIPTPSEKVQLAAVQQTGYAIKLIKNPSEQVQLAAVQQTGYAIKLIKNPSEQVQLAAVKQTGYAIGYIKNPSEKVQLAAVAQDGLATGHIPTPSEKVQLAAVKQTGYAIQYIKNPSEKVQLAAVQQTGSWAIKYIIENGITPDPKIQVYAIKNDLRAYKVLKNEGMISPEAQEFYDSLPKIGEKLEGGILVGIQRENLIIASPKRYEKHLNWKQAVKYSRTLNIDDYADWYLPSEEELHLLWVNEYGIHRNERNSESGYWSSSEDSASSACVIKGLNATYPNTNKTKNYMVRAFRRVPLYLYVRDEA